MAHLYPDTQFISLSRSGGIFDEINSYCSSENQNRKHTCISLSYVHMIKVCIIFIIWQKRNADDRKETHL